ncbi:MAG: ribosome maturation factor RimM [Gammaproteobacteria bacterium]|nr:ribosome maturation factor RimM [Gammaproteobacteria bacterium]
MTSSVSSPVMVGRFGRAFGVLGWIKIISFTTPRENILDFQPWLIRKNDQWEELYFESSKSRVGSIIVKLASCNSPEEVSSFTNIDINILREQLPKLSNDEYYWDDLIGLEVINTDGVKLGVVQSLLATGSNDVLVVMGDSKRLIPYVSSVIVNVDLPNKSIHVDWGEDFL